MSLNKRVLAGEYDLLVIATDLEPDDLLAMRFLADALRAASKCVVLVGEGNLSKRAICEALLKEIGVVAQVIEGQRSDKDFPLAMLRVFRGHPQGEQSEQTPLEEGVNQLLLQTRLRDSSAPLVICLKPPRELLALTKDVQQKLTLVCYGSFNFRALGALAADWQVLVNTCFKETLVYESFRATGAENSLSNQNSGLFDCALKMAQRNDASSPFWAAFFEAVRIWNKHIAVDCLETIEKLARQMRGDLDRNDWTALRAKKIRLGDRNLKVVNNIIEAESLQMVLADCALAAVLCLDVNVSVRRKQSMHFDDNGYTQFVDDENGRVGFFEPVPFTTMVAWVVAACKFPAQTY